MSPLNDEFRDLGSADSGPVAATGPGPELLVTPESLVTPELSVVIPFYNPGPAVRATVSEMVAVMRAANIKFEVIAVDDGSTDGSAALLADVAPEVRVESLGGNRGKGAALRRGFARARGAYVSMIDADGDIHPLHLVEYLEIAQTGRYPVVVASRAHPESLSGATRTRKLMSNSFNSVVATFFDVDADDTQVGCKLFHSDVIAQVLPWLREDRFAFDLEFFVLARRLGIGPIHEAPVVLRHRLAGSTVGPAATAQTIRDAAVIFGRLRWTSTYDVVGPGPTAGRREFADPAAMAAAARAVAGRRELSDPGQPAGGTGERMRTVRVLGVRIADEDPFDMVSRALADYQATGGCTTVLAMHITALNAIEKPGLRAALEAGDYLHADGVSVALVAKVAGAQRIRAVPTTDLGPRFLDGFTARWGRRPRVAIVGGNPGVADAAMLTLVDQFGVEPAYATHGYHSDWASALADLRRARPDIVFIGLGMPLEAFWVRRWREQLPDSLVITCGGWLRLLSGDEERAPEALRRLHLEFAWRWATDFGRTNERYSRGVATVAKGGTAAARGRWQTRRRGRSGSAAT